MALFLTCTSDEYELSNEVVYFILIDRFVDGDPDNNEGSSPKSYRPYDGTDPEALKHYQGGDLVGITQSLDDLAELGITMIWISPFLDNSNTDYVGWWPYHGYHPIDFYAVDEHFGNLDDLKALVNAAHRRNMKVIFDMPFNQTAADHPWVEDPEKKDWFHWDEEGRPFDITDWFDQDQIERGELHGLPDLAQENAAVTAFILDVSRYWIETTGCDGFRLDAVKHIPISFWERYNKEVKAMAGDDFILMGEVFWGEAERIKPYHNLGFDLLFDIPGYYAIRNTFNKGGSFREFSDFYRSVHENIIHTSMATIIDNHDVARFDVGLGENAWPKQKLALSWLLTSPGMPVIYSGTEIGMKGYPPVSPEGVHQDYLNRLPFPQEPTDSDLARRADLRELIDLRLSHPSLMNGSFHEIYKDWSVYAFLRHLPGETMLVLLNNASTEEYLPIPIPEDLRNSALNRRYGSAVMRAEGEHWYLRIPPNSMSIWEVTREGQWRMPAWTEFTDRLSQDYQLTPIKLHDPEAQVQRLQLAGDFNNWTATDYRTKRMGDTIHVELPLKPGHYEYKLVLNNESWIPDPGATEFVTDPYGGRNSILVVKAPEMME